MELRKIMREKGIRKEFGCSWIEVNKKIYIFIFRDMLYLRIDEIIRELKQLVMKLRGIGYVLDINFIL